MRMGIKQKIVLCRNGISVNSDHFNLHSISNNNTHLNLGNKGEEGIKEVEEVDGEEEDKGGGVSEEVEVEAAVAADNPIEEIDEEQGALAAILS